MNFFHQHDMTNQFPEGMTFFMNHPVYTGGRGISAIILTDDYLC